MLEPAAFLLFLTGAPLIGWRYGPLLGWLFTLGGGLAVEWTLVPPVHGWDHASLARMTLFAVASAVMMTVSKAHRRLLASNARRYQLLADALLAKLESEQRFRATADVAPVLMWMSDETNQCTWFNKPWLEYTGQSMEGLLGQGWLNEVHPNDQRRVMAQYMAATQQAQPFRIEYRLRRRDGSYGWVLDLGVPRTNNHEFLGFLGTCVDITDRKVAEQRMREADKMEAVSRLAGGIAHDFNNMLTAIAGNAQLLLLDAQQLANDQLISTTEIMNATKRATELTRQLLTFSRRGGPQVSLHVWDLRAVVDEMLPMLRRVTRETVRLGYEHAAEPLLVYIDRSQLEQVILNLIVNANDAMAEQQGTLSIYTTLRVLEEEPGLPAGQYVELDIWDTGCGMDEATQARIFEPFFTTKLGEGTGLGLATCYTIVTSAGGMIRVQSRPGEGARFTVLLPFTRRAEDVEVPDVPHKRVSGSFGRTVLLVEDEPMVRQILQRMMVAEGFTVVAAANGQEALRAMITAEPDIVLTDMVMPGMDGHQLGDFLEEFYPHLPVIYMSGYAPGPRFRPNLFLQKPVSMEALLEALDDVLSNT